MLNEAVPLKIDDLLAGDENKSIAHEFFDQKTAELHKTLGPCTLTEEQKKSVLRRLEEKSVPGEPQTSIVKGRCRFWTGSRTGEYGDISAAARMVKAHRVSYEIKHDVSLRTEIHVRHLCANALCNNPDHLALGNAQENANDKVSAGRSLAGDKHPKATISEETAKKIGEAIKKGWKDSQIAEAFKCSMGRVASIRCGDTWSSVTGIKKRIRSAAKTIELQPEHESEAKAYVQNNSNKVMVENKEHWIWKLKGRVRGYYGEASFKSKRYLAHKFSWRAFNGCRKVPKGMQILHSCKFKDCVNPGCLTMGDAKQNAADKIRDGTHHRGVRNPMAKLTKEQVLEIRGKYAKGASQAALAKNYGVASCSISDAVNRKTYTDI